MEEFTANNNLVDKEQILAGLQLATGSPCIGAGAGIADEPVFPLTADFWGERIGSARNIGAYNH